VPALSGPRPSPDDPGGRAEILAKLRTHQQGRPPVDPELAGGLRAWLEDGAAAVGLDPDGPPLVVDKQKIQDALSGGDVGRPRVITTALVLGSLVDTVFRQLVTVGDLADPWDEAWAALGADPRQADAVAFVDALDDDERTRLRLDLDDHAARMARQWPALAPGWLPRTQERLWVPLAGGRVVLKGVVDLALGAPPQDRASVCLVEVKSGRRRFEHRADLHYYALLETIRDGAPPFRVATYYTATGELDAEGVTDEVLTNAVRRTLDAVTLLARTGPDEGPAR